MDCGQPKSDSDGERLTVVGVGASAGGLEALTELLEQMSPGFPASPPGCSRRAGGKSSRTEDRGAATDRGWWNLASMRTSIV
jgi:hypothetical protein